MISPTKSSFSSPPSSLARVGWVLAWFAVLILLAACSRPSETEPADAAIAENTATSVPGLMAEAVHETPDAVLKELQRGLTRIDSYRVRIEITVLYHDGTRKEADGSAWFNRRARVGQPSGGRAYGDPLLAKLDNRDNPWQSQSLRAVSYRQPGQWSTPLMAIGYLNRADEFTIVEDNSEGLSHYRARFDERPDLGASLTGWYFPGWDETVAMDTMEEIYGNVPLLADVWIDPDRAVFRHIELVTRGMAYPAELEEPNDLKGAVEERIVLTFTSSGPEPAKSDEPGEPSFW